MPAIPHPGPADVRPAIRVVSSRAPLRWLALGWADLLRCPLPGLLHGLAALLFGGFLLGFAGTRFWMLAGAFSGFLLVAPLLATGLYAISRALEQRQPASLATALRVWKPRGARGGRLVVFGVLLALSGTGWVLTSAALITTFAGAPVRGPADFLHVVVLNDHSVLFEVWLMLGAAMAAPMFASTVVTIPLLLDREVSLRSAVLTSVQAVMLNPAPMAMWAVLILTLTMLAGSLALLGLIVVVPWLAHASWHAYRELVAAEEAR